MGQQSLTGSKPRALVVVLGALGDFILALPLIQALSQSAQLLLATRGGYRALLPPDPPIGEFFDTDGPFGAALFTSGGRLTPWTGKLLHGAQVHLLMRSDDVVRDNLSTEGVSSIVWHNPRPAAPPHVARQHMERAGFSCPESFDCAPVMPMPGNGNQLWIHPGSGSPSKNASPDFFAEFAKEWRARDGGRITLSFGEADLKLHGMVKRVFEKHGVPHEEIVCPSLGELREALANRAALYLGNDSGVSHLAAALGVPTIACFLHANADIWRPVGRVLVLPAPGVEQARSPQLWQRIDRLRKAGCPSRIANYAPIASVPRCT